MFLHMLNYNSFYHATLCIGAVFAVARCPSVRLFVYYIQTAKDIKLFGSVAPSFYFFDPQRLYPIPRGAKYTEWENFAIFD